MCGISGIYSRQLDEHHKQLIQAILDSQINRGPDFQQFMSLSGQRTQVLLGHNRLSIIDLSNQANQSFYPPNRKSI